MSKYHRFYKNVSGSIIYVTDMNNWEIPLNAEIDINLVPQDLLNRSIYFGRLIATNKIVPINRNISEESVVPPPVSYSISEDAIKEIADEVAKIVLNNISQGVYKTPDGMSKEELSRTVDEEMLKASEKIMSKKKVKKGGTITEVVDSDDIADVTDKLKEIINEKQTK